MASGGRKWFGQACRIAAGLFAECPSELQKRRLREPKECCIRCNSAHFGEECNGGGYQTITSFIADLFQAGGDGILQYQDGTPALTSAQWSELDAALAKAPHPAPASPPASSPTPASTPTGGGGGNCAAAEPSAAGQATSTERGPALLRAGHGLPSGTGGGEQ
jgi:hypothetical protein